jgi:hypothetical protein
MPALLNSFLQIHAAVGAVTSVLTTLVAQLPGLDRLGRKYAAADKIGSMEDAVAGEHGGRERRGGKKIAAESPRNGSWSGRTASKNQWAEGVSVYSADRHSIAQHAANGESTNAEAADGSGKPRGARHRGLSRQRQEAGSAGLLVPGPEIAWLRGRSQSEDGAAAASAAAAAAASTVLGIGLSKEHRHVLVCTHVFGLFVCVGSEAAARGGERKLPEGG